MKIVVILKIYQFGMDYNNKKVIKSYNNFQIFKNNIMKFVILLKKLILVLIKFKNGKIIRKKFGNFLRLYKKIHFLTIKVKC
jgi:hypothetical protein